MKKPAEDSAVFRDAVRDVKPIAPVNRVVHDTPKPRPLPAKREEDERAVLAELAHLAFDGDDVEIEDDAAFLRPGLPREILRKLKRTHWVIQDTLDLHGLTGDEAVAETAVFLAGCRREGRRCVRIVHGKGLRSEGAPVLKVLVDRVLRHRGDVLAFASAPPNQGGSGAVLVLLDNR